MVRLIRTAHMLDFVIFDWEFDLLVLMEWGSCLQHLPGSSCFKFLCLLFLEESCLVLTSLGVFIAHGGGVHTVKWWITGAESWLQAWFTAGQRLNHSTQPDVGLQHFSCLENGCWYIHISEKMLSMSYIHSFSHLICNVLCFCCYRLCQVRKSTGVHSPVTTPLHRQPPLASIWIATTSPTGKTAEIFLLQYSPPAAAPAPTPSSDLDLEKTGAQLQVTTWVWRATVTMLCSLTGSQISLIKMHAWTALYLFKPGSPSMSL